MKKAILFGFFVLSTILSNSQIVTVSTKGLQVYFRPKNLTLKECQEQNLVDHRYFGNGDCQYIFNLNTKIYTMRPQYVDWEYSSKIVEIRNNDHKLDITTEDGTRYLITDKTENKEKVFLIEYFDLNNEVEGRFALNDDYSVSIK